MPRDIIIIRFLQIALIAIAITTFQRQASYVSSGLDFALNRPASIGDQRRTILQELPSYFLATDPNIVVVEALDRGDVALAKIYVEYASKLRRKPLSEETLAHYEEATSWWATTQRMVTDCAMGAAFRESDNMTAIGCQLATDLFVIGDVADITNEGYDWYVGHDYDEVILGLSLLGAGTSALSITYPAAAPAAGGVAAAKLIARPATKGFRLSAPLRRAVKNAIDFDALELARKNTRTWKQALSHLQNPLKFFRPKETELLMDGLSNISKIGQSTDIATATRVLRQAENFDDLGRAVKIIDITGSRSKTVLNVMGLKALKFAKAANPIISATKYTYKASFLGWGILVGVIALFCEVALRRGLRDAVKKRKAAMSNLKGQQADAELGTQIWKVAGGVATVSICAVFALKMMMEAHISEVADRVSKYDTQAEYDLIEVYLEDIKIQADTNNEIYKWTLQNDLYSTCSSLGFSPFSEVTPDPVRCRQLIKELHDIWGISENA